VCCREGAGHSVPERCVCVGRVLAKYGDTNISAGYVSGG
jgi:hypothetical protein